MRRQNYLLVTFVIFITIAFFAPTSAFSKWKCKAVGPKKGMYGIGVHGQKRSASGKAMGACKKRGGPCRIKQCWDIGGGSGKKSGGKVVRIKIDLSGKRNKKKVSAKEAKKIAVSTRAQAVAAIPPSIDDITAILRDQKPDQKLIAALLEDSDEKPPKTKSKPALAQFYLNRGNAAGKIGRTEQQLADLTKAVQLAKASGVRDLQRAALWELANAEGAVGLRKRGLAHRQAALKLVTRYARRVSYNAVVSVASAQSGRLGLAGKHLADATKLLRAGLRKELWDKYGSTITARVKFAQAVIYDSEGDYEKAENLYRDLIRLTEIDIARKTETGLTYGPLVNQVARTRLSRNLETQGRIVEAEIEIRKALLERLRATGLYSTWAPRVVLAFAQHLVAQGRYEEAKQLVTVAIDVMQKLGFGEKGLRMTAARMTLGRLEFLSGQPDRALAMFDQVARDMDGTSLVGSVVRADLDRLLVMALSGQHDQVISILESADVKKKRAGGIDVKASSSVRRGALAIALAKSGDREKAYNQFKGTVPELISLSQSQADEEYTTGTARTYRTSIILEAYLELLASIHDTPLETKLGIDATAEAFQIADVARGQLVQKAVSAASARAAVDNKGLAELVRNEQDTRKRLTAQSGLLAGVLASPSDQQDTKAVSELRGNISNLKKALDRLLADIKKKFPNYAALLNPQAPGIREIQAALSPGEAFVSIYLGREQSYVWALPKSGEMAFHASGLTQARAAKFVEALRDSLNPQVATLGDIPDFDVQVAFKLYKQILQPVENGWRSAKSVLVSTNGALGQLPLTVLPTENALKPDDGDGPLFSGYRDVKWLARSHAMTLLPSAATLVTLRSIPKGQQDRKPFIGFGDPLFNKAQANDKKGQPVQVADSLAARGMLRTRGMPIRLRAAPKTSEIEKPNLSVLPRLPDTADEVRSIALAMQADPSVALMLGMKANEDTIRKQDLSGYKVIAFATHGLIPGDLSGLREPALALSSPDIAKSKGDGLLTMSEIMGLKLDADWVVLSACNTGSGRGAGAEAISGLGRAFFYAGTRALLVSSWPVETTSARLLTTDVFDRLTKDDSLSRAVALQHAISALIDKPGQSDPKTNEPLFYYAHPIFWAPFILVGDGGGA